MKLVNATFTRPANTTPYTAGDVIGELLTFGADFSTGRIESAVLVDSASESVKPDADLFLFDEIPDVAADNSTFAPTDVQLAHCVAVLSFLSQNFKTGATNGVIHVTPTSGLGTAFVTQGGKLYGVLVARNAYTPISQEIFVVRLGLSA